MAQFTKPAIMDAFQELLEQTPLDKITVQDITQRCHISRNTFYYHFGDIYALLEAVLRRDMEHLLQQERPGDTWVDGLRRLFDYMSQKHRIVCHIYHSLSHDILERYLYQVTEEFFMKHIREAAEGLNAAEEDLKFICFTYQSVFVGILLNWLRRGMHGDVEPLLERTQRLFCGNTRWMLERCERKDPP